MMIIICIIIVIIIISFYTALSIHTTLRGSRLGLESGSELLSEDPLIMYTCGYYYYDYHYYYYYYRVYIHIYIIPYIYVCVYIYIYICISYHIYIYIYIYIYIIDESRGVFAGTGYVRPPRPASSRRPPPRPRRRVPFGWHYL